MKIQIPGTGCHNCLELKMRLAKAIPQSGRNDVKTERIDDEKIIRRHMPLDAALGLLIDGQLVSQHEVPTVETLLGWLKAVPA